MYQDAESHKAGQKSIRSNRQISDTRDLVRRFKAGKHAAFVELLNAVTPKMRGIARAITRNGADAEDVIQNAALRAYAHIRQLRSGDRFKQWVMRIAVNEALQHRRLACNRLSCSIEALPFPIERPDPAPLPLENMLRQEVRRAVLRAIRELRPQLRGVLILHYWKHAEIREISRTLGLSEASVKTRLHRARKSVLALLEKNGDLRTVTRNRDHCARPLPVSRGRTGPSLRSFDRE